MQKKTFALTLIIAAFSTIVVAHSDTTRYANPVVNYSLPDPTIIRGNDNYFYLYATEDIRNLPIHKSKDLVNWELIGTAFTEETRPTFEPKANIWAPDISKIGDKYILHYSMSVWGGESTCGIGAAIADSPQGPFHDKGMMFRSNSIGVRNSIDPFYIEDGEKKYLFWGSFRGIYAIELSDDGLQIKESAEKQQIAGTAYEGVYIYKRNNYYYLFASIGSCCDGLNSKYTTVVGRADNLFGPYVDKDGNAMMNNNHEVVIAKNNRFVGPGHNSEIVEDDNQETWFFYHAIDVKNPKGRVLLLDKIEWINDWPVVGNGTPSITATIPYFK